jgi:glucose/mannose transport system substrate-binding protein
MPSSMRMLLLTLAALVSGAQAKKAPAPAPAAGQVPSTEVVHFWVSGSEQAALGIIRKAFEARGGVWKDRPAKNNDSSRKVVLDRIVAGYPPAAMQWHAGPDLRDIVDMGAVGEIDEVATRGKWVGILPTLVTERATYRGKFYLAPMSMHAENWFWSNSKVLADAGLAVPRTWEEFLAIAPQLEKRGVVPLAIGGGDWEAELLFNAILVSQVGKDAFRRLMDGDAAVLRTPGAANAFRLLARMRQHVGTGFESRTWSDATAEVIAGRAGMQLMGDWAKGEFLKAGLAVGKDFQCTLAPGTGNAYFVIIDAFAFPTLGKPEKTLWQQRLAETMLDPAVQLEFSRVKGSIPVRLDVDLSKLDVCAQLGMKVVAKPENQISPPSMRLQFNMRAGMLSLVGGYFKKPDTPPEQAAEKLAQLFEQMGPKRTEKRTP